MKEVDRLLPAQGAAPGRSAHRNHGGSLQVILLSGSRVNRAILLALIGVQQKFFLGFIAGHFQQWHRHAARALSQLWNWGGSHRATMPMRDGGR